MHIIGSLANHAKRKLSIASKVKQLPQLENLEETLLARPQVAKPIAEINTLIGISRK